MSKTATKSRPTESRTRSAQSRSPRNGRQARPNGKTLSTYITERFDEFSRSQKDVARYIVDHLDDLLESEPDIGEFDVDPSRRNAVRMMNLHQVKGLEAPVVFLAQTVSWYLVQPYVRGLVVSPVDEWPGATTPSDLSIAPH